MSHKLILILTAALLSACATVSSSKRDVSVVQTEDATTVTVVTTYPHKLAEPEYQALFEAEQYGKRGYVVSDVQVDRDPEIASFTVSRKDGSDAAILVFTRPYGARKGIVRSETKLKPAPAEAVSTPAVTVATEPVRKGEVTAAVPGKGWKLANPPLDAEDSRINVPVVVTNKALKAEFTCDVYPDSQTAAVTFESMVSAINGAILHHFDYQADVTEGYDIAYLKGPYAKYVLRDTVVCYGEWPAKRHAKLVRVFDAFVRTVTVK